jgi:hypothetical protein
VQRGGPTARERYASTTALPRGSQKRLIDAALFSAYIGAPVNTLITINAAHLQRIDRGGVFGIGHLWDGFRDLLERLRKWCINRNMTWACFWAREVAKERGEHWHIALHVTARHRQDLAAQIAAWVDDPIGPSHDLKPHDIAVSALASWHITTTKPGRNAKLLGAYLGKAEPNRITLHAKTKLNPDKVITRWPYIGGEGHIEGKRYGISKTIGATEQTRTGWTA